MRALTAWLKATVQYNPTFPISALLLMGGVYRLLGPVVGATDVAHVAATAGVIAGYELVLVALALLVLWPRRVVYETTSSLVIESVLRFAPAVTILLLDPRENLGAMLLIGGIATALVVARTEAIARIVGVAARPWERAHSAFVAVLVALGVPCFARALLTAGSASRPGAFVGVLALALVLAPGFMLLGRGPLESTRALGSRLPVIVARLLEAASVVLVSLVAFWLGDVRLEPVVLLPFFLLAILAAVSAASATSADGTPGRLAGLLPVPGALALVLVVGADVVAARTFSPATMLAATLPLAIGLAVHFRRRFPGAHARLGERAALLAAAVAPLRVLPATGAATYALVLASTALAFALARRHERLTVASFLALGVSGGWVGLRLAARHSLGEPIYPEIVPLEGVLTLVPVLGALLAAAGVVRFQSGGLAERTGSKIVLGAAIVRAVVGLNSATHGGANSSAALSVPVLVAASLGLAALGIVWARARARRQGLVFGADLALLVAGPARALVVALVATLGDGVVLVGLAFVALPVGVLIGIKRERLLSSLESSEPPATRRP